MSSIPRYQRIPSLEALALSACISAQSSQDEPMEVEGERPLNSVPTRAQYHWKRLKKYAPRGLLGIQKAIRTIEEDARNSGHSAAEASFADGAIAPFFPHSEPLPKDCKVTELFRQLIAQLNEELIKNGRPPLEKVLVAPEQFEFIQASLRKEAEQWALKFLCNEIRKMQDLPEATDEEFEDWLANLAYEAPMLDIPSLNLQHPKIQALPNEIRHFQRLQHLSLGADPTAVRSLRYLPESICNLTNLTHLDVSYNELEELPQPFHDLVNLLELDLSGNELESLSESFGDLTRLTRLNLQDNRLEKLPESFCNLTNLGNYLEEGERADIEMLDLALSYNCLKELPKLFGNLVYLNVLDLSHNQLGQLPLSFGRLENLLRVNLNSNNLKSLPNTFTNLRGLEWLDFSSNKLKKFPGEISNLNELERLDLSDNEIEQLPEAFGNLQNLTKLDLASNKLRNLPSSFERLRSLEVLHLESNKLSQFPSSIISNLGRFEQIYLSHNSITMLLPELKESQDLGGLADFKIKDNPLLLISDVQLKKIKSLSKLLLIQSQNFYSYKPCTNFSSLFLALAREDIPAAHALLATLSPDLKDRILSRYQTLAALETQELHLSYSSSSSSSSSSSQAAAAIHPFKYPNLLGKAFREEVYSLIRKISSGSKAAVISKVQQLASIQNAPLEERAAEAFDTNLLRLADVMALMNQDLKRKATNSNPPSEPLELKRLKKEEEN